MRKIKFIGKTRWIDEDEIEPKYREWIIGYLYKREDRCYIISDLSISTDDIPEIDGLIRVDCKSVGQYTEFKDRNGKEIYEKHIVKTPLGTGKVVMSYIGCWQIEGQDKPLSYYIPLDEVEIVGNAFDNPELLNKR